MKAIAIGVYRWFICVCDWMERELELRHIEGKSNRDDWSFLQQVRDRREQVRGWLEKVEAP